MQFAKTTADFYVPDGTEPSNALARTTHLAIGAHQDDLEIMSFSGILACFQQKDRWYTGVVATNGSGSPRTDVYADFSDDEMRAVRKEEQRKAAHLGEYAAMIQLDYPSAEIKDGANLDPVEDLQRILEAATPEVVYLHNLADKHDTHIGTTLKCIEALRRLDPEARPRQVLGCEVWRDLDWLVGEDKVALDVSAHEGLQTALLGVFDSQVCGGKRYDLAAMGRRRANATFAESHSVDVSTGMTFAMDLTPLVTDPGMAPAAYVGEYLRRFTDDVLSRVESMQGTAGRPA